jgi:hypothetical protein
VTSLAQGAASVLIATAAEVLAYLLKHKLIDGNNMTVTGKTLGENLDRWTHQHGELGPEQDVIRPLDKPIKETGHLRCGLPMVLPAPSLTPQQHPAREPRARWRGREDYRQGGAALQGQGARVRLRGRIRQGH